MRIRLPIIRLGIRALLIAGFLSVPCIYASEVADSEHVSKLLSDAKTMAFQLKEDAVAMESFTRMELSWQSHVQAITQIKEHVNALARQTEKLKAARDSASPWQKIAINRITPFLDELGGYTTAAIEHINGDRKHTLADYRDYLEANADYATDLAAMIGNFVDYGEAKDRRERLGAKLEIPATR